MPQQDTYRDCLRPGVVLDRKYTICRVLGRGGFGIVYSAMHEILGTVAIKEYFPREFATRSDWGVRPWDGEARVSYSLGLAQFLEEARRLVAFREHSGIVTCHDCFRCNNTAYLVMDHIRGKPLSSLLRLREERGKPFEEDDLLRVMIPLLAGLGRIHRAGVMHRDVKPANILIRDADQVPVLIDFGAARQRVAKRSRSLSAFTDGYAAFEQVSDGKLGPWTDIYAAGALMWRMVAGGRPPFQPPHPIKVENRVRAALTNSEDPMPSARDLGRGRFRDGILAAIDRCLQIRHDDRMQNCEELLEALSLDRGLVDRLFGGLTGRGGRPSKQPARDRQPVPKSPVPVRVKTSPRPQPRRYSPRQYPRGRGNPYARRSYRDHGFVGFTDAVVIDVDTTGLDPERDRIVAVSFLMADFSEASGRDDGRPVTGFSLRFNPGVAIPVEASRIHGISDRDVSESDPFAHHARNLRDYIGELPVVGHNVSFDQAFLSAEFRRAGVPTLDMQRSYCTMGRLRELRGYCSGGWYNSTLDDTAKILGVGGRSGVNRKPTEDALVILRTARRFYQFDNGTLEIDLREQIRKTSRR